MNCSTLVQNFLTIQLDWESHLRNSTKITLEYNTMSIQYVQGKLKVEKLDWKSHPRKCYKNTLYFTTTYLRSRNPHGSQLDWESRLRKCTRIFCTTTPYFIFLFKEPAWKVTWLGIPPQKKYKDYYVLHYYCTSTLYVSAFKERVW